MLAEREAVVAREDDDGVLPLAGFFEGGEDPADVVVQSGHAGVVISGLLPGVFFRTWPRSEALVSHRHLPVVPRVLRQEGRRERDARGVIHRVEAGFGRARVVRDGRGEVGVERSAIFAAGMLLQEGNRPVGEPQARVRAVGGGVGGRLGVVEDARLEGLEPLGEGIASLAHMPGAIAGGGQHAGQEGLRLRGSGAGVLRARDALPGPAGQHHRAAGRADRADHRTLGVSPGEGGPAGDECVEVRGEETRRAERPQAVGPVVIGMDVEDVRPRRRERKGDDQGQPSQQGTHKLTSWLGPSSWAGSCPGR